MKVKKKRKKVILQISMICALIFSFIRYVPDVVYADASSIDWNQYWYRSVSSTNKNYIDGYKTTASGKHVTFYSPNCFYTCVISTTDLSSSGSYDEYKSVYGKDGPSFIESCNTTYHKGSFTYNGVKYFFIYSGTYGDTSSYCYVGHLGALYNCTDDYLGSASKPLISGAICDYIAGHLPYTCTLVCDGGEDGIVSTDMGSVNNPIEDSEIGTIVISKYRFQGYYRDSEDENDCDFTFQWKNKTSTGFSLTKNKYAHTVIQCRVQSRCVVYKDLAHKQILKEFKNFGESAILYNSINVENNPYSIAYSYIKEKLPKTMKEIHNPLYVGYEYRFFFRVMCSDDLAVIPGDSSKWYAGGWRSVDLNASAKNEQNPNTSNGHFDDDDNWVTDKDDGNNSADGGSTVSKDKDDARDDFANGDGKAGDSTLFDWNSFKGLINQCKEIPGLIKSVFSFLPDWVLVFIAIGFGIWIFVLIKRAIV